MSRVSVLALAAAAMVVPTLFSGNALAGSIDLSAYGWMATFDQNVDLTVLSTSNNGVVVRLQKFADFTQPANSNGVIQPLSIVFRQMSSSAVPQIAIEEENVFNDTGSTWKSFQFSLQSNGTNSVTFDTSKSADFSTSPFNTKTYSDGDRTLTVSGGSLPSGTFPDNQWQPGRSSGALYINANPGSGNQSFVFLEQPNGSGSTPPPPTVIPLPASASLSMGGFALLLAGNFVRRRLQK
jgi:hypothetical protein